jgi:hypothetical protein
MYAPYFLRFNGLTDSSELLLYLRPEVEPLLVGLGLLLVRLTLLSPRQTAARFCWGHGTQVTLGLELQHIAACGRN